MSDGHWDERRSKRDEVRISDRFVRACAGGLVGSIAWLDPELISIAESDVRLWESSFNSLPERIRDHVWIAPTEGAEHEDVLTHDLEFALASVGNNR